MLKFYFETLFAISNSIEPINRMENSNRIISIERLPSSTTHKPTTQHITRRKQPPRRKEPPTDQDGTWKEVGRRGAPEVCLSLGLHNERSHCRQVPDLPSLCAEVVQPLRRKSAAVAQTWRRHLHRPQRHFCCNYLQEFDCCRHSEVQWCAAHDQGYGAHGCDG